jgi:DNA-binding NarL/FixJ family response regulator
MPRTMKTLNEDAIMNYPQNNQKQYLEQVCSNFTVDNTTLHTRETLCIYYLIRGMTAKQIGIVMSISERTVEGYIVSIKNKLGCANRYEIITKALNSGFPLIEILQRIKNIPFSLD